jgi:hypothetical protein
MPVKINGATSGSVTLAAPATGTDVTVTLPAASGTPLLDPGAWTTYVPVLTATNTNPNLGNGNISGYYTKIGRTVHVQGSLSFGSSGVSTGDGQYYISLPIAGAAGYNAIGTCWLYDSSAGAGYIVLAADYRDTNRTSFNMYQGAGGAGINVAHNGPFAWAASDQIRWHVTYQSAS